MKKILHPNSGFTLVEMLIALLIVSIAFSAVLFSVSQSARTASRLEEKVAATWIAEDLITRAQLGIIKAGKGSQRSLNKNWQWEIRSKFTQSTSVQEIEIFILNQNQETVLTKIAYVGINRAK
jgi:general secretion pathway protein I